MGDRSANIARARAMLLDHPMVEEPHLWSTLWETPPMNCPPGSPDFVNAVGEIGWSGESPITLLAALIEIEVNLGRVGTRSRNAPRPIDIDILYFDEKIVTTDTLTIPHPRLRERLFVLHPLSEIRPELVLPGETRSIAEIRDSLLGQTIRPFQNSGCW